MLTIAFSFIIIPCSIQSNQAITIPKKPYFLFPDGKRSSAQEKPKYQYVGIEKCALVCHNNEEMMMVMFIPLCKLEHKSGW